MKPNLRSLNKMDFLKVVPNRQAKIEAAPAKKLPEAGSYKANALAAALHPIRQHLIVSEVIEQTPDTKSFVLIPDAEAGTKALAYFSAGQYLAVSLSIGDVKVSRPYSISSSPREALQGRYMLSIKRTEGGLVSQYALDHWQVGTKLVASAPLGVFTYEPLRDAKRIVGIAGGSGITPFRALAKAIADGDEDAELTLLYGSRSLGDALFYDELRALAASCPRFTLVNVLSDVPAEGAEQGFITAELIKKYAPKEGDYSLFICGPQAMYEFVDKEVETLGLRNKFIRHELFGEYRHPERNGDYPAEAADATFNLTVRMMDEEHVIAAKAEDTLLNTMERAGLSVPAECRSGQCGWCRSRLVGGNVYVPASVDGRRMADLQFGYVHPCCTFPLGDVTIDVPPVRA